MKVSPARTVLIALLALALLPAYGARLRSQVESILGPVNPSDTSGVFPQLNIVLVYGEHDHATGQHEYQKFADEWQPLLSRMHNAVVSKAYYWPSAGQWQTADLIVFHLRTHNCNVNTGTGPSCTPLSGAIQLVDSAKFAQMDTYLARGKGIVTVHPANYPHQMYQDKWADRTGIVWKYFGSTATTTNTTFREGKVTLNFPKTIPHPITTGLPDTLIFDDEVYFPLYGHPDSITVLATSSETFNGVTAQRPALWTYSRPGSTGRSFGFIMGHLHASFSDPVFRILLLRGMAWAANENFNRFRRVVLDSAIYVNDVVGVRAGSAVKPPIRANEGAGKSPVFDWKGKPRQSDGRAPVTKD